MYQLSPYSAAAQQQAAAYLQTNTEDREVICSNLSDRVRLLLDILQLTPPPSALAAAAAAAMHGSPARDPNQAPSPKPLFGTRPPPAALALQRGFSVGARDRAERERAAAEQREREGSGGGGGGDASASAAAASSSSSSSSARPTSPMTLAVPGASSSPYSSAFDSPYKVPSAFGAHHRKEGPLCAGWLSMQKNAGKWKRFWCEYAADGVLSYRVDDTTRKPSGTIQVSYAEAEITPLPKNLLNAKRFENTTTTPADGSIGQRAQTHWKKGACRRKNRNMI